jgi:hypothetical protein
MACMLVALMLVTDCIGYRTMVQCLPGLIFIKLYFYLEISSFKIYLDTAACCMMAIIIAYYYVEDCNLDPDP